MIKIINKGGGDPKDIMGTRWYEVWINDKFITSFQHKRANGLGACLFEASKAVDREKWESLNNAYTGDFKPTKNKENKK